MRGLYFAALIKVQQHEHRKCNLANFVTEQRALSCNLISQLLSLLPLSYLQYRLLLPLLPSRNAFTWTAVVLNFESEFFLCTLFTSNNSYFFLLLISKSYLLSSHYFYLFIHIQQVLTLILKAHFLYETSIFSESGSSSLLVLPGIQISLKSVKLT